MSKKISGENILLFVTIFGFLFFLGITIYAYDGMSPAFIFSGLGAITFFIVLLMQICDRITYFAERE